MTTARIAAPDAGAQSAVGTLLFSVLRLTEGDRLVVVLDPGYATQAAWLAARARRAGVAARLVGAAGWGAARLGSRVRDAVAGTGAPDAVEGEPVGTVLFLGGQPLDAAALALPSGVTALQLPELPWAGSPLDAVEDPGARAALLERLRVRTEAAGTLVVSSGEGERLALTGADVRTDPQDPSPGRLRIAPLGRVVARVAAADGVFVADGRLRLNRTTRLGTGLAHRPVRLEIRDGRVTGVECPDPVLGGFLRRAVDVHRAGAARTAYCRPAGGGHLVTLRLTVDPSDTYSTASADLRIDLTARAAWDPGG